MQRFPDGTPCPGYFVGYPPPYTHNFHAPNAHPYAQSYALPTMYEDTADIEYTTELQAQIRKAKPRRRVSLAPSSKTSIAIHEDTTSAALRVKGSNFVTMAEDETTGRLEGNSISAHGKRQSLVATQPRRRRVSAILADRLGASDSQYTQQASSSSSSSSTTAPKKSAHEALKKEARRRTIYIPDDTTVVTIHPGVNKTAGKSVGRRPHSPDIGFDLVTLSEEENEEPLKPAMREKKAPRKSLAVAPKRAPLRQSIRPHQTVAFAEDIMGTGGGKENIPPGKIPSKAKDDMSKFRLGLGGLPSSPKPAASGIGKATLSYIKSPKKRGGSDSILDFSPKPTKMKMSTSTLRATVQAATVVNHVFEVNPAAHSHPQMEHSPTAAQVHPAPSKSTSHISIPFLVHKAREQKPKYQVLEEDLAHTELYEDHWLHYQETALTQLLNGIFEPLRTYREPCDHMNLRRKILALYHDPHIPLLHKRLQASLQYGALSIPKDLLAKASRVKDDIGLRKKFLTLFVETYNLDALRAAAEAIVGREISQARRSGNLATSTYGSHARSGSDSLNASAADSSSSGSSSSSTSNRQFRTKQRAIERFLHTFLIKHEDAVRVKGTIASIARGQGQIDFGSQAWAWRRTVLRSLMLIHLLDKAKTKGAVDGCLFQTSSPHKSSAAVLNNLASLILPSLGDLTRPLGHLNYTVGTVQQPLQEYAYTIDNLATDLRDGVVITRLVEVVLFSTSPAANPDIDQTMTIAMPSGEEVVSTWTRSPAEEWILSKHLKFPCGGRSVKLYNVQLALCAVAELGGAAAKAAKGVTAEDIVDGHRERTLSLLWAIIGNCALESLVDWEEVKKETQYFNSLSKIDSITDGFLDYKTKHSKDGNGILSLKKCSKLLLAWAQSIVGLNGIQLSNLTTSFASHSVFEGIVDAYLPYFPSQKVNTSASGSTRQLRSSTGTHLSPFATKLTAVGSSAAFISLFDTTSSASPIPSKSFTLSTLTFLASRLIPIARTHRAASTIQRAYRAHLARLQITKRVVSLRLAAHCAMVVRARERVVNAATVLQRAWRIVLDRRIEALVRDVVCFQAQARGWLGRERVRGGGKIRKRRIRGGW